MREERMVSAVKQALLPTGFGLNCAEESYAALCRVGFTVNRVHLTDLFANPEILLRSKLLVLGGGFSFGDHLGSGLRLAQQYSRHMGGLFQRYIAGGGLIIGICNGFQVLLHLGLLGAYADAENGDSIFKSVSLVDNIGGRFIDRWVDLEVNRSSSCVFTKGLTQLSLPIRHGEGRLVFAGHPPAGAADEAKRCFIEGLIPLTYRAEDNVNGSDKAAAALTNKTGRIFGLMPHPEAAIHPENHPDWRARRLLGRPPGDLFQGLELFRNAYQAAI